MQHLQKTGGVGMLWSFWSHLHTGTLPRPISFVSHSYENCRVLYPKLPFWKRVYSQRSNVQPSNFQTILSSSSRPIAAERPWCHNWQRHENSSRSGETTLLSPVSKITRADFGNRSRPLPVTDSDSIGVASRA